MVHWSSEYDVMSSPLYKLHVAYTSLFTINCTVWVSAVNLKTHGMCNVKVSPALYLDP